MKKLKVKVPPSPGSEEAIKRKCLCPVIDNNYGAGFVMGGERCWWQSEDCPLHGPANRFDREKS